MLFIFQNLQAQGWQKHYDSLLFTRSVEQTFDGGYIMAGGSTIMDDSGLIYIVRTDMNGDTLWTKNFNNMEASQGAVVKQLPDSGFIVCANYYDMFLVTLNPIAGLYLLRLDKNGDTLWTSIPDMYAFPYMIDWTSSLSKQFSFAVAPDGGFSVLASATDTADFTGQKMVLFKFDSLGTPLWAKKFGVFSEFELAGGFCITPDGGYALAGTQYGTNLGSGYVDLIKTDSLGNTQWDTIISGLNFPDYVSFVVNRPGGGYTFGIESSNTATAEIICLDAQYHPLWTKQLNSPGCHYYIWNGTATSTGYLITGNFIGPNQQGLYFLKLDLNGTPIFERTYPIAQSAIGYDVKQTNDGGYILAGSDNNLTWGNTPKAYLVKVDSSANSFTNIISGKIFNDLNGNCIQDVGENSFRNWIVQSSGNSGPFYALTDTNGHYEMVVDSGNYVVTQNMLGYHLPICPSTNNYNLVFNSNYTTLANNDFANGNISNVQDLQIVLTISSLPTPGLLSNYFLTYTNEGTIPMTGTITFTLDTSLSYVTAFPSPLTQNNNVFQWPFSNLLPQQSSTITFTSQCDSTVVLGTLVTSIAHIDPIVGDSTIINNADTSCAVVTSSFDPNFKEVMPEGNGSQGLILSSDKLTYTIHFQNTGTDTAIIVIVRDTIDSDLDLSTFKMLSASHNYSCQILPHNIIKWIFYQILLPDSTTNDLQSQGFVKFSILPKWNDPLGTIITNNAEIYFDYNTPVITNATLNTIGALTSFSDLSVVPFSFIIFPNPSNDFIIIQSNNISGKTVQIKILDIFGQTIVEKKEEIASGNLEKRIDVSDLSDGVYFVSIQSGENSFTQKIIVQQ
jgi:hypothetical protein